MATHGFIELKENRKEMSGSDYANERTGLLLHSIHDGYDGDMIYDVLLAPFFIYEHLSSLEEFKNIRNKINDDFGSFERLTPSICLSENHYMYRPMVESMNNGGFHFMKETWGSIIPLDDSFYTFPRILVAYNPLKYELVPKGMKLYGGEVNDGNIIVEAIGQENRMTKLKISFNEFSKEESEEFFELDVEPIINDVNRLITLDENKVTIDNDRNIYLSIDKMVIDLIYQDHQNGNMDEWKRNFRKILDRNKKER